MPTRCRQAESSLGVIGECAVDCSGVAAFCVAYVHVFGVRPGEIGRAGIGLSRQDPMEEGKRWPGLVGKASKAESMAWAPLAHSATGR